MLQRAFAATFTLAVFAILAADSGLTQTANPSLPASDSPVFAVADVHKSPPVAFPHMDGGNLRGQRYDIRQATMLDLIVKAYGMEPDSVQGGPNWLEWDRFDIVAKAPTGTAPATLRLMLQALLKERFNLIAHKGTAPLPAYILRAERGESKLKPASPGEDFSCKFGPPPGDQAPGTPRQNFVRCQNVTMDQFAERLRDLAGDYLNKPVVNASVLNGAFDFDLHWYGVRVVGRPGSDGTTIFDALEKQLGLKLTLETAPRPALVVDSVNESPTPNQAGIEKLLPPPPPLEFEVASIKPSKPDTREDGQTRGDQLKVQGITLNELIRYAWDMSPGDNEALVNAPKWLDTDRFDILAKVAAEDQGDGSSKPPQLEDQELKVMTQSLLEDRFQMKVHWENRPVTSYILTAVSPKMTRADPKARTKCFEGPGPDGKDPRIANAALSRLLTCQNITMAQFADRLRYVANGYVHYPIQDATGLEGRWDFTLSFSGVGQLLPGGGGGSPPPDGGSASTSASDPNGALSLFDAVKRELGLKLEKQQHPEPVLVIDHIEEQPTEN